MKLPEYLPLRVNNVEHIWDEIGMNMDPKYMKWFLPPWYVLWTCFALLSEVTVGLWQACLFFLWHFPAVCVCIIHPVFCPDQHFELLVAAVVDEDARDADDDPATMRGRLA